MENSKAEHLDSETKESANKEEESRGEAEEAAGKDPETGSAGSDRKDDSNKHFPKDGSAENADALGTAENADGSKAAENTDAPNTVESTDKSNTAENADASNAAENADASNAAGKYGFDGEHHTYCDPNDGTVYIWDREKNGWFPKVDDDFLAHYQMSYGFVDNVTPRADKEEEKKDEPAKVKRKNAPEEPCWFELDEEHNTKVYVSNLPLDVTEQEFVDFMQKCGLVMKDINTNKWKVKLYKHGENGELKGDALCTYIKRESVELALKVLDGSDFRGKKIEVQRAKFQMKGEYNPALKPRKKRKKEKEREKKIQQKLFDWRPDKLRGQRENHERTVIIKNLFEPSTFDNQVQLILEYSQDLREECSKCGVIKKLVIYDKHPEGVAQVTFSDAEEADICVKLLNNRWFSQRKITAETWDGKTKYKSTESEADEKERLLKWNEYLETGK